MWNQSMVDESDRERWRAVVKALRISKREENVRQAAADDRPTLYYIMRERAIPTFLSALTLTSKLKRLVSFRVLQSYARMTFMAKN